MASSSPHHISLLLNYPQLNGGTLDGSVLTITSENTYNDEESVSKDGTHLEQHEKPRAGSKLHSPLIVLVLILASPVAAEYLAHGYILTHKALERAIEIDSLSTRFLFLRED